MVIHLIWLLIAGFVLAIYAFLNLVLPELPGGLLIYILTPICWLLLILTTLKISRHKQIDLFQRRLGLNKSFIYNAVIIAFLQIVTLIFAGMFTSFGRSPYAFTPLIIIINLTLFLSTLLGMELARAYIIKTTSKQRPTLIVGLTALLFASITISLAKYTSLTDPLETTTFFGSMYIPALAKSLLASYLAYVAGPLPAITYRGILGSFEWFSPILPNPTWSINAFISVMIPTIGFIAIHQATTPSYLRKVGRVFRIKKSSMRGWIPVAILCVLAIWASTGLLGFRPTVICSGSMKPTMDTGDIAIGIPMPTDSIQLGDIVQYAQEGDIIVHRVYDIYDVAGSKLFITKGDANNAPDKSVVSPNQILGKVVFTIPKLGWASITIKTLFTEAYAFFTTNLTYAYTTLAIIITTSAFGIHRYRNQPLRKLRRRLNR